MVYPCWKCIMVVVHTSTRLGHFCVMPLLCCATFGPCYYVCVVPFFVPISPLSCYAKFGSTSYCRWSNQGSSTIKGFQRRFPRPIVTIATKIAPEWHSSFRGQRGSPLMVCHAIPWPEKGSSGVAQLASLCHFSIGMACLVTSCDNGTCHLHARTTCLHVQGSSLSPMAINVLIIFWKALCSRL